MTTTITESQPAVMSATSSPGIVLPFLGRVWHQFCHECRRQIVFLWLTWLIVILAVVGKTFLPESVPQATGAVRMLQWLLTSLVFVASVFLPCWIAGRCAWASRPAAMNLGIHTRPVGRAALWLGQTAFLTVAVVAPRAVMSLADVAGFGFTPGMCFWVVVGSGILSMAMVGAAVVLASLARTGRQFAGLVALAAVWITLTFSLASYFSSHINRSVPVEAWSDYRDHCARWMTVLWFGAGTCLVWAWHTITRRHRESALVLALILLGAPCVSLFWSWDWLSAVPFRYTGSSLQLVTAAPDRPIPAEAELLWNELAVTGLPATCHLVVGKHGSTPQAVDDLRNIFGQYSDFQQLSQDGPAADPAAHGPNRRGVESDFIRTMARNDPNWTWQDTARSTRPSLKEIWRREIEDRYLSGNRGEPWHLKLLVYEPHVVAELPLSEMLAKDHQILLGPGQRLHLARLVNEGESVSVKARLESGWPAVMRRPTRDHVERDANQSRRSWCGVVFLDDANRVAQAMVAVAYEEDEMRLAVSSGSSLFSCFIPLPLLRMQTTGLDFNEWVKHVRVQIWWPESRGTAEFDVSAMEMLRLSGEN